jgi:hypothetical protein
MRKSPHKHRQVALLGCCRVRDSREFKKQFVDRFSFHPLVLSHAKGRVVEFPGSFAHDAKLVLQVDPQVLLFGEVRRHAGVFVLPVPDATAKLDDVNSQDGGYGYQGANE